MQIGNLGPQRMFRRFMEASAVYIVPSAPDGAHNAVCGGAFGDLPQQFGCQLQYLIQLLMRRESYLLSGAEGSLPLIHGEEDLVVYIDLFSGSLSNSVCWICSVHDASLEHTVSTAPREYVMQQEDDEHRNIREDVFKGILEIFDQCRSCSPGVL